ncbi:uncharacterized protein LOC117952313 isoform X2 [Etheostoma cragini]|uniref:uncharacterized protein LOC117952313 isoform X2 n=1 Tax=Etheostoma cragini TaxID=417921 RepID=UPI00155DE581|nr:uncharacterized protein LOC117952313 isoform X2 [Etheostoma cragini]
MEAVIGLLVMILGVSHGVETYCDGRQDGAQCYGALGGTVVLQLMDNASEIFRYTWSIKPTNKTTKTNTTTILHGRKNVTVSNLIANRSIFTPSNGTFRINNLNWTDGGEYELLTFDSDGKESEQRTLQLTIQDFINCTLTNGTHISQWVFQAKNIPCIQPTTSPPMRTSTGKTTGITVSINPRTNNTSYNHSDAQWYINYLLIMAGVLVALVILLVVGVAVVCAQKKKRSNKPKEEEEDNELTYADVRFAQRPGRQMPQRPETEGEVEYGQVKFSERPQQTVEPAGDECVYAKVRKDR